MRRFSKGLRSRRLLVWLVCLGLGVVAPRLTAGLDRAAPPGAGDEANEQPVKAEEAGDPGADAERATRTKEESTTKRLTPSTRRLAFEGGEDKVVVIVEIHDVIDLGLAPYLERVLEDAAAREEVVAVVAEIDTPGGRVDAAVRIRDALLRSKVTTVAFIDTQAISAGALIAYAHDFIVVAEGASMGAATPIQLGGGGTAEPVGEKMTSYMRGVMRATAEAKGRDADIAEAMVDATVEVPGVSPEGKLLTATKQQLLDWGVADMAANSIDEVLEKMELRQARIERPKPSWAEVAARGLTHPIVSSLLMTLGFLGILIELYTPGFGFPGILGLTALVLFFAGHLVVELAGLEELILFVVGVALLFVEVFVTPGFGAVGLIGVVAIVASLVMALIGLPIRVSFDSGELFRALAQVSGAIVATFLLAWTFFRFLPRSRAGRKLVLAAVSGDGGPVTVDHELGSVAATGRPRSTEEAASLVGARGVALSDLRPSGSARIAGKRMDVVTQGDFLEKGTALQVVEASSLRVVVRPASAEPPPETGHEDEA